MEYWKWVFGRFKRQLWWQSVVFGIIGLATALLAAYVERHIPWEMPIDISREAIETLLAIISSSMLAVTTFSLGTLTAALGAATSNVTPRATKLLMEDPLTQHVLSSFIGSFVFSIVAIVVLKLGSYGDRGRAVLFFITVLVLAMIVVQLLRWINYLISLGRVGSTIERLETATRDALNLRLEVPYLGCNPWFDETQIPEDAKPVYAKDMGYIQFVDIEVINKICEAHDLKAWLPHNAGTFTYLDTVLVWVEGELTPEIDAKLTEQFITESTRAFEQDPRFGFAVLAEVGSRALSPATNDPGTAIDIIGRQTRLLALWSKGREDAPVKYERLYVHPISDEDLFEDAFMLMARDGAHLIEVQLRLQKSLRALQDLGSPAFKAAAKREAERAYERAKLALTAPCDLVRIQPINLKH